MSRNTTGTLLWFDVETRYKTTINEHTLVNSMLWFDVETRYKTTSIFVLASMDTLWFDVETRYKTTVDEVIIQPYRCGLM